MAIMALAVRGDTMSNQARTEAIIDGLFDLPRTKVLKLDDEMKDLINLLIDEQSLLVFERGYDYTTALEEVALMHGEGILAGEIKHGPPALVDENVPITVIANHDTCASASNSQLSSSSMPAKVVTFGSSRRAQPTLVSLEDSYILTFPWLTSL